MKAGAVMGSLIGLFLLGIGLRMIGRSFDPEKLASVNVTINGVEPETIEEKTSSTRIFGFIMMGMSVVTLGMSALFFAMEWGRDSRIPLSILCLLAASGFGAVAFRAGLGPAVSGTYAALFGLAAALLWGAAGLLLLPYVRAPKQVTSSS